jgi:hypothetical protein
MCRPDKGFWVGAILALNAMGVAVVHADSVSKFAGTCQVDDSLPGGADWTNTSNLQGSSDDAATTVSLTKPGATLSDYLKCTAFGFAIPAGSTIDDFTVTLRTYATTDTAVIANNVSNLRPGTSYSNGSFWGTTYGEHGFGSLFNLLWTSSEVNDPNFGFRFRAEYWLGPEGTLTAGVDSMQVTVFYTPPPPEVVYEDGFETPD